ncbi:hypothetical protein [Sporocytophaga myxococcoides]|nr:hypothetical protein [Sporocytophaga myxococcoides]
MERSTKTAKTTMGKNQENQQTIVLKEDTVLNQHIIDQLDELLSLVPPQELMQTVIYVFFMYIYYAENDVYDSDLKATSENFYLLYDFLTHVDNEMRKAV